jgi:hypothetical protein
MSTKQLSQIDAEVVANCDHLALHTSLRSQFPPLDMGNR